MIASINITTRRYTAKLGASGRTVNITRAGSPQVRVIGVQGPPGAASGGIEYPFLTPAAQWTINHNLGYRPSVTLRGISQAQIGGDVDLPNVTQAIVTFASATAGYARVT